LNRRHFLKALAASSTAVVLPVSIGHTEGLPTTVEEFRKSMEAMFNCNVGFGGKFVDEKLGCLYNDLIASLKLSLNPDQKRAALEKISDIEDNAKQYYTLSYHVEDVPAPEAERILVQHLHRELKKISAGKPDLFWRSMPTFETIKYPVYGVTWQSAEQYEDRLNYAYRADGTAYRLYSEFNSAGDYFHHLPSDQKALIPEDVELDFHTGDYKYLVKTVERHVLRMRLFVDDADKLAKKEGGPSLPVRRIA